MPMDFFSGRQPVGPGGKGAWRIVLAVFQGLKYFILNIYDFACILVARISHLALSSYRGKMGAECSWMLRRKRKLSLVKIQLFGATSKLIGVLLFILLLHLRHCESIYQSLILKVR